MTNSTSKFGGRGVGRIDQNAEGGNGDNRDKGTSNNDNFVVGSTVAAAR